MAKTEHFMHNKAANVSTVIYAAMTQFILVNITILFDSNDLCYFRVRLFIYHTTR